ncbi:MAG TPA: type II toxin-antitoxin system VapC family toxin [Candidatus Limnocylindria bacterium]|nr:type II toxin-antitoxin system VapC family toxin [Candidatus Limnocylindria bacterium]
MTLTQAQRAVVVDASVAIPFLQGDPDWRERWAGWIKSGDLVLVPPHFPWEVANALLRGTTIKSVAHVVALVQDLFATGFEVADRGLRGMESAVRLAGEHDLTVYDAAYLDLAIDVDGGLATADRKLLAAAKAEAVPVIG